MLENVECSLRKCFRARRNPYSSIAVFSDAYIDRQYVVTLCLNVLPLSATSTANYPKLIDYQVHICTGEYHEVNASCSSSIQFIGCTSSIPAASLALLQIFCISISSPVLILHVKMTSPGVFNITCGLLYFREKSVTH